MLVDVWLRFNVVEVVFAFCVFFSVSSKRHCRYTRTYPHPRKHKKFSPLYIFFFSVCILLAFCLDCSVLDHAKGRIDRGTSFVYCNVHGSESRF